MKLIKSLVTTAMALAVTTTLATTSFAASAANTLLLTTKDGTVVIELLPNLAPAHVERISKLANSGFYDGLKFHRVIDGFMAQTGDPLGNGTGGSDLPDLKAEFSNFPYERGTVGMARSGHPDSANSQFFIMFGEAPGLNGQYTVFGRVVEGMEVVDQIKKGNRSQNGAVRDPDTIHTMRTADQ